MTLRLETERLIMRPLAPEDAEAHIAMMQDPEVAGFLTQEGAPRARTDEWRAYASMLGHAQMRGFGFFSVFEKSSGDWVGRVGPWMPEEWPALECGWAIARPHWGKGYAPEAAVASINWIFNTFPDLTRIISAIDPKNENSQAVARKIGETKTGETFPLWNFTLDIWAADRNAWLKKFGHG
ncbi:MAG: GNAT family N-acetyltransferase [Pseudomonadota bacterium]